MTFHFTFKSQNSTGSILCNHLVEIGAGLLKSHHVFHEIMIISEAVQLQFDLITIYLHGQIFPFFLTTDLIRRANGQEFWIFH